VVRLATPEDADGLIASLIRAFDDDPVFGWVLRDDAKRAQGRDAWFRTCLDAMSMPFGHVYVSDGCEGAAMWVPPGQWSSNPLSNLPILPDLARATGLGRLHRLAALARETDRVHPAEDHFYLLHLGVDPAHQGQRLGSALLRPVLQHCDETGLGAYLECSDEVNLRFYERQGFEVTCTIKPGFGGPTLWPMWRAPAGSGEPAEGA